MQNCFIVGSKGIPGSYGGYETFVDKLTEYHQNNTKLKYHVACKSTGQEEFEYHNARCFPIKVPNIGSSQAIYYDILALRECCKYIEREKIKKPIVYILACRIGPFMSYFHKKIKKLGGKIYINPDGHEWLRAKWSMPVRKYWKLSERQMIKYSDLVVCDSKNIEQYIKSSYGKYKPSTCFIPYGAELGSSSLNSNKKFFEWCNEKGISPKSYYLVVGRFVPENNYETMIREFMLSDSEHELVLITETENKFLKSLKAKTGFDKDSRIKFVGTVYEQELLTKIRDNAYAYIHGHEVGGTNPSLLESMGNTKINLLMDVGFNREVAKDGAIYWNKESRNLATLINVTDGFSNDNIERLGVKAKERIANIYSWERVSKLYEEIFLNDD